jgi:sulfur-carrier protein adenylyltransferase/sulfurtransferase
MCTNVVQYLLLKVLTPRYLPLDILSDVCAIHGIPWIYSAILAFEGQLSVFNLDATAPDYRDLLPTPPAPGDVPSCAEGGVLGILPGTMGCLQATEAIKLILGHTKGLLVGRVLVFDALAMKFSEIGLARSADRAPITELIDYQGFCGAPQTAAATEPAIPGQRTMDEVALSTLSKDVYHVIAPRDCWHRLLNDNWAPFVVDVRLPTEHEICRLPFTDVVVPHRTVQPRHLPAMGDVLVYCKAGVRGATACQTLIRAGVEPSRLYNLQGGILQWQKDVDPSLPRY